MNVFELFATLTLDRSEYDRGLSEAESSANQSGANIANALVSTFKRFISIAAIGKFVKDSLDAGAALQQSIGGIETLFGTNGQTIEEYAASMGKAVDDVRDKYHMLEEAQETALHNAEIAYKTAGLSANDYMQTVTGFAASLKSSGLTELEAAKAADDAIIAMSDNVNKMGTSMGAVQYAYMGFAKQNYTMLDNLKLGYGGTRGEMERLLADAEKLSGVKYDISNLADVYKAIQVIQDNLGITGTTAKEAATTFTGSFAAMSAAAQNLMADLSLGNEIDFRPLIDSVSTFVFGNLIPMFGNVVKAVPEMIEGASQAVSEWLGTIADNADAVAEQAAEIIAQFAESVSDPNTLVPLVEAAAKVIAAFVKGLVINAPKILEANGQIFENLLHAIYELLADFGEAGAQVVQAFIDGIIAGIKDLFGAGEQMGEAVHDGLRSKVFGDSEDTGEQIVSSVEEGVDSKLDAVEAIGEKIAWKIGGGIKKSHEITDAMKETLAGVGEKALAFANSVGQSTNDVEAVSFGTNVNSISALSSALYGSSLDAAAKAAKEEAKKGAKDEVAKYLSLNETGFDAKTGGYYIGNTTGMDASKFMSTLQRLFKEQITSGKLNYTQFKEMQERLLNEFREIDGTTQLELARFVNETNKAYEATREEMKNLGLTINGAVQTLKDLPTIEEVITGMNQTAQDIIKGKVGVMAGFDDSAFKVDGGVDYDEFARQWAAESGQDVRAVRTLAPQLAEAMIAEYKAKEAETKSEDETVRILAENYIAQIPEAMKEAMNGISVYLDNRKVGNLVTGYQRNMAVAMG